MLVLAVRLVLQEDRVKKVFQGLQAKWVTRDLQDHLDFLAF